VVSLLLASVPELSDSVPVSVPLSVPVPVSSVPLDEQSVAHVTPLDSVGCGPSDDVSLESNPVVAESGFVASPGPSGDVSYVVIVDDDSPMVGPSGDVSYESVPVPPLVPPGSSPQAITPLIAPNVASLTNAATLGFDVNPTTRQW
jgi:hypothetical protein